MKTTSVSLASLLTLLSASCALAQPVLITAPTVVGPTDTTIGGVPLATALITVQGTTLTISGRHTVGSLSLIRSAANAPAIVTHPTTAIFDYSGNGTDIVEGLQLTITGALLIEGENLPLVASRIDVSARGFTDTLGPGGSPNASFNDAGGASHGGNGGAGNQALGGATYGSVRVPALLGSGGGSSFGTGVGGGRVRLAVGTSATINGQILANGQPGNGGGGSGGSIHLSCASLAGSGLITADGGASGNANRGGGGGGRVAVYSATSTFSGTLRAFGGVSSNPTRTGGSGTVYVRDTDLPGGTIFIENSTTAGEAAIFNGAQSFSPDSMVIRSGGKVSHDDLQFLDLTLANLTIDAGAELNANFRGFTATLGPGGSPNASFNDGGGASHGGNGGDGTQGPGGVTYGSVTQPTTLGSGGGSFGGRGGGAIKVTCTNALTINGEVLASGATGSTGGSGGSIFLRASAFSGAGSIASSGGNSATANRGAGGGGRISVTSSTSSFTGTMRCFGGISDNSARNGGPGTIFVKDIETPIGTIIIENASTDGEAAILNGDQTFDATLLVKAGGKLSHDDGQALNLSLAGGLTVETGGRIDVSARGFPSTLGPGGAPNAAFNDAGGASHGGNGGDGNQGQGGVTYGSVTDPVLPGSGGGSGGGTGGGALRISASGPALINGQILAHGTAGSGGGGSGGSILLLTGPFTGSGLIAADGGDSGNANRGGGGGGRISYTFGSFAFGGTIRTFGGLSANPARNGGGGTVFLKQTGQPTGTIVLENASLDGEATILNGSNVIPAGIHIKSGGKLSHDDGATLDLVLGGGMLIDIGGRIDLSGRGFPSASGPGAASNAPFNDAGGAAHGGNGGNGTQGQGGRTYGSVMSPVAPGSGGGSSGGPGGGAAKITVNGPAVVNGEILANGTGLFGGGGSGGSIWLISGPLSGTGLIAAEGCASGNANRGGGGGGRIAAYYSAIGPSTPTFRTFAGISNNTARNGGPGTVYLKRAADTLGTIIIENSTLDGEAAILNDEQAFPASLLIKAGGKLSHDIRASMRLELDGGVTIDAGGTLDLTGRGFGSADGPGGAPNAAFNDAGGGGYGGAGAPGVQGAGGRAYGSIDLPTDPGSGGGSSGGSGGGALILVAQQPITINGSILANGTSSFGGGGSGGAAVLVAPQLSGSGIISADGGIGGNINRGGGGGGRVAIYTCDQQLPLASITALGGGVPGPRRGQDGTVRFGSGTIDITQQPFVPGSYPFNSVVTLSVVAQTSQTPATLTYQWRRNGIPVADGDFGGRLSGATTPTLTINPATCRESGIYDCLITDACGGFPSNAARVTVQSSAEFNGDGILTPDDLDEFITGYFNIPSDPSTDFNDDGIIEPGDLDDYITQYFEGCA